MKISNFYKMKQALEAEGWHVDWNGSINTRPYITWSK